MQASPQQKINATTTLRPTSRNKCAHTFTETLRIYCDTRATAALSDGARTDTSSYHWINQCAGCQAERRGEQLSSRDLQHIMESDIRRYLRVRQPPFNAAAPVESDASDPDDCVIISHS
jgi:hypothetical protein